MSAAVTPARRLLALLAEEPSLETGPRDEIEADLAVLGIDSAGTIRLARRLADQSSGPATALLGAMIEDESVEAEIAALETADIAEVRSRLQAGTVAAVTAEAQRRAGKQSNVVGISRPRRGAVWAWTGSLVGMAACALIVVAAWWPPSELLSSRETLEAVVSAPESVERRAASSDSAPLLADGSAPSNTVPPRAFGVAPPASEPEPAAMDAAPEPSPMQSLAVAPPSDRERLESPPSGEAGNALLSRLAPAPATTTPELAEAMQESADPIAEKLGEPEAETELDALGAANVATASPEDSASMDSRATLVPPAPPPTPAERQSLANSPAANQTTAAAGVGEDNAAESASILPMTATPTPGLAGAVAENYRGRVVDPTRPGRGLAVLAEPVRVVDVLIVDPISADLQAILMPEAGIMYFDGNRADVDTSPGNMSDRLAVARRTADGRPILALLTLQSASTMFDAVLVRRDAGLPMTADSTRLLLDRWFGDRAGEFALIALPPRP